MGPLVGNFGCGGDWGGAWGWTALHAEKIGASICCPALQALTAVLQRAQPVMVMPTGTRLIGQSARSLADRDD